MKKCISVFAIACLLIAITGIANAAKETVDSRFAPDKGKGKPKAAIPGPNDKRIITPHMNNLERYETMRNIKKRAAAKRNFLILQAFKHKQALKQAGSPGQIPSE